MARKLFCPFLWLAAVGNELNINTSSNRQILEFPIHSHGDFIQVWFRKTGPSSQPSTSLNTEIQRNKTEQNAQAALRRFLKFLEVLDSWPTSRLEANTDLKRDTAPVGLTSSPQKKKAWVTLTGPPAQSLFKCQ